MGTTSTIANSVVALVVILLGATFFTNPVEILSERLGTPQEDVGTALPESVIAAVAILELDITGGEIARATDIGIGAILETPFVLATWTALGGSPGRGVLRPVHGLTPGRPGATGGP